MSGSTRRLLLVGALAAVAGAVVAIVALTAFRSDSDEQVRASGAAAMAKEDEPAPPPETRGSTAPAPQVTGAGAELTELLDKGKTQTFHARYVTVKDSPLGSKGQVTLEVWNKPPQSRNETHLATGGERIAASDFRTNDGAFRCSSRGGAPWQCQSIPSDSPSALMLDVIKSKLPGRQVTSRDEQVAGRPGRCFTIAATGGGRDDDVCVGSDGIPLKLGSGDGIFELAVLEFEVADDVFTPPAKPIAG